MKDQNGIKSSLFANRGTQNNSYIFAATNEIMKITQFELF